MRPAAAKPSAAIVCRDLASRPAWREVVNVRSWRGATPASRLAAPPPAVPPRADAGGHVQDRGDRDPQVELVLAVLPDHEEDEKCVDQANPDLSAEWRTTSDAVAYLG